MAIRDNHYCYNPLPLCFYMSLVSPPRGDFSAVLNIDDPHTRAWIRTRYENIIVWQAAADIFNGNIATG